MEIEIINLDGETVYQVSWQGERVRRHDQDEAVEMLKSFSKLKEWTNSVGLSAN